MNYYDEIKRELINNEINKRIKDYSKNRYELEKYYNVGKLLSEAGKHYGNEIIKEYSNRLKKELNKKYDISSLNKMRKFYNICKKMATVSPNLSYSHYVELLTCNDIDKIKYYIAQVETNNLSVRQLRYKIKSKEYERLPNKTKIKLKKDIKANLIDLVKKPIIIKNTKGYEIISEKILQKLILEDIPSFLEELGSGFTFIKNEYKIKLGEKYNYIDLLLYNIEYNCYVVIELKTTDLKKEHIGQIQLYMNYINENIKKINQEKTIGIIICKQNDKYIIKYCSDKRIISTNYLVI